MRSCGRLWWPSSPRLRSTTRRWLSTRIHPWSDKDNTILDNHALPIGMFLDPGKISSPQKLIDTIIAWYQHYGHPSTRISTNDQIASSLAWLDNPFTTAWLSATSSNADQFACTWHLDVQLTSDYPALYSSTAGSLPVPLSPSIHPADALFTHPKFVLAAAVF